MSEKPALQLLSLGAGVQSTTLVLMSASGELPKLDGAIFADTGWEPQAVYTHLDKLEREVLEPAGIPLYRVSEGNIREDALDPTHRFASMPLFVIGPCSMCLGSGEVARLRATEALRAKAPEWVRRLAAWLETTPEGLADVEPYAGRCPTCSGTGRQRGMARRQCTSEYKLKPIKRKVRELLGYPHPHPVPRGLFVEQWVGISKDEVHRAKDSGIKYARNIHPLLDLGMSRRDCLRVLHQQGWTSVAKSACIGCPFHGNSTWRQMRDSSPEEFKDAVEFDAAIRGRHARANAQQEPLRGQMYLHSSGKPLDEAPIDRRGRKELEAAQTDMLALLADIEVGVDVDAFDAEVGFEQGCGPWSCRSDGA